MIAAYNAGSPRTLADGTFENQGYVDAVTAKWEAINGTMFHREPTT